MISVSEDHDIDYELTARLATEAFASPDVTFSADRLRWFYEQSFSRGTVILAIFHEGIKVGHAALVKQSIMVNGAERSAAQFVDLFILRKYRSRTSLKKIYQEIEKQCRTRDIRCLLAMPNDKAAPVNIFFLKLDPFLMLPIRCGISLLPAGSAPLEFSGPLETLEKSEAVALFSRFDTSAFENGLKWNAEHLYRRLTGPGSSFGVHATRDLLLISSQRSRKGINYTLLCGFFARPEARVSTSDLRNLVRAACRLWRRAIFVYVGINDSLPDMPGTALPDRLRPSPMHLQLRDFQPGEPFELNRFQLIDFDFV
jgi:hypothetical protein